MQSKSLVAGEAALVKNFFSSMSYGEFLKRTRREAGLSQLRLAELVSSKGHRMSAGAISNIERDYYKKLDGSPIQPHKRFVVLAAEICGVDVNEALREADYAPLNPSDADRLAADLAQTVLASGFDDLQDEDLRQSYRVDKYTMKVRELMEKLSKADPEMDVHVAAMISMPDGGTLNVDKGTMSEPDEGKTVTIPNMMRTFEATMVAEGGKVEGPRICVIGFVVPVVDVLDDDLIH